MKKIKNITILFVLLFSLTIQAQDKLEQKAAEMTKELNVKLGEAKLTSEQEQKATAIYVEKLKEIRDLRKSETDAEKLKEQLKEVHKKYAKRLADEVLTKDQKEAFKQNKNNKE